MSDRYAQKPFLEFLDSYVLDAIGALSSEEDAALTAREGEWRAKVVLRMQFPAGMAKAIREVWESGRTKFAAVNGHDPDPREFARIFIDSKFPH